MRIAKYFWLLLVVGILGLAGNAMATPISYIQFNDGIHPIVTVYDGQVTGWNDIDPTSENIGVLHQILGNWTIASVFSSTLDGNPDVVDIGGQVIKTNGTGTGTLTITFVSYFDAAQGPGTLALNLSASALGPTDVTSLSSTIAKYSFLSDGTLVALQSPILSVGPVVLNGTSVSISTTATHASISNGYAMKEVLNITSTGSNGGTSFDDSGSNSVVPEPASLLLLGTGLVGMGVFARRKLR